LQDGSDGRLKAWWAEIAEEGLDGELRFLRGDFYRWPEAELLMQRLSAADRFTRLCAIRFHLRLDDASFFTSHP
jgi:hypothetical protein